MLANKIAEDLYNTYCDESSTILQNCYDYRDAEELVNYQMDQLRKILPAGDSEVIKKFYYELENYINHREAVSVREAYKYAFNQGAKFILELLADK